MPEANVYPVNVNFSSINADSLRGWPDARVAGRLCALSTQTQRAIQRWTDRFPGLIEQDYIAPVTDAFVYASPWSTIEELLLPLAFELWVFAVDKLIDTDAQSLDEVENLVKRILDAAEGGTPAPDDQPALALADIVGRLSGAALWPEFRTRWRELFRATFEGMITEWRDAVALANGDAVSFDRYIANSDSCGFRIIRLTSWIACGDHGVIVHIEKLMAAAWDAEISSRLTNDLRSWARERHATDLNALKLGVSEDEVCDRIRQATADCSARLEELLETSAPAIMLDRILAFGNGFYEIADFRDDGNDWGLQS